MRITKNKIINLIFNSSFGVLTIFALTKTTIASAAGYIPLEPLTVAEKSGVSISTYLNDIFRIGIGLAGVFAVLMIVIGGIGYIAGASNPSARSEARKKITNAIFGLILASASWLILYTINPKLLNTELLVPQVKVESSTAIKTKTFCFPQRYGRGQSRTRTVCEDTCPEGATCSVVGTSEPIPTPTTAQQSSCSGQGGACGDTNTSGVNTTRTDTPDMGAAPPPASTKTGALQYCYLQSYKGIRKNTARQLICGSSCPEGKTCVTK